MVIESWNLLLNQQYAVGECRKEYNQQKKKPKNEGKTTNPPTRAQEKGENTDINQRIIEHVLPSPVLPSLRDRAPFHCVDNNIILLRFPLGHRWSFCFHRFGFMISFLFIYIYLPFRGRRFPQVYFRSGLHGARW